jgi:two-component system, OmpR family, osmolarity sensor histidine kinase EnvZ
VKLFPGSLLWRTLAVLVAALVLSQAAALWLLNEFVTQPRVAFGIGQFVSHLKTINAALATMDPEQQQAFIARIAEQEGIRILPVRGNENMRPALDAPVVRHFRERVRAIFGPEADVGASSANRQRRSSRGARRAWRSRSPPPSSSSGS